MVGSAVFFFKPGRMEEVNRADDSEIQSIRSSKNENEGAMEEQDKPVLVYRQDTNKVDSQGKTDKENNRLSSCYSNKEEPDDNEKPKTLEIASTNSSSMCENGSIVHLDEESELKPNDDENRNAGDSIPNVGEGNSDTGNGRRKPHDGRPNPSENTVNFLTTGLGSIEIKSDIPEMGEPFRSEEKVSASGPAKSQVDEQNIQSFSDNLTVINSSPGTEDMKEKEKMVTQTKTTLPEVTTKASETDQSTEKCFNTMCCTNLPDKGSFKIQALTAELKQKEGIINSPELQNSIKEEPTPTNEEVSPPREVPKLNEMQTRNEEPTQMDTPTPIKVLTHYAMAPGKVYLHSDVPTPNKLSVHNEVLTPSEVPQSYEMLSQEIVPTHKKLTSNNREPTHNEQHTYNEASQCNLNAESATKITAPQTREKCVTAQISKPLVKDGFSHTMQKNTSSEDQSSVNDKSVTFSDRGNKVNGEETKANAKKIALESLYTLESPASNSAGEEIKRSLPSPLKYTTNTTNVILPRNLNTSFKRQHHYRPKKTFEQIPLDSWVPQVMSRLPLGKPPYNVRRRQKYIKTSVNETKLNHLIQFYENKTVVDAESEDIAVNLVDDILETILSNTYLTMSNQFSTEAHDEGSVTVDTKVGKLDESDHSVEILVEDRDEIILSDEPFDV